MQGRGHSGGRSVHAGVRVAAQDSAGRERLLRYCARPMFAGERLVWAGGGALVRYRLPCAALQGHRPEQQQQRSIELRLSASEFLDRVAALIPPPRKHRHRYFGVLAPNSPWRSKWCSKVWRRGWRGGAWIGVDQALAWCGEWCELPNPNCRHSAFSACYAHQISANTKHMRSSN